MKRDLAQMQDTIDRLAGALVEARRDIDFLLSTRRATKPPAGLVALKEAAFNAGWSYSAAHRLVQVTPRAIGAVRHGGRWYCDPAKLAKHLAARRAA